MKKILYTGIIIALITCMATLSIVPVSCNGPGKDTSDTVKPPPDAPKSLLYSIGHRYYHDTSSFTEGLLIYNGKMYESTGLEGKSKVMQIDIETGKPIWAINLDPQYFGEGISIVRDTIYVLTYKSKKVLVYTLKDLKKVNKEFSISTEGWGMTTDGKELIASDGSSNLYYYDPTTFRLLRTQSVTEGGSLAFNVNELEYIDGYIYANQWQAPYILKIDPSSGAIVAKADLTDVWNRVKAKDPKVDVPNGIAYDPATKKMYVTGKYWPDLYEIQLSN